MESVTLTETINQLRQQGYTEDFNLKEDCIECKAQRSKISADDFVVDKYYRFEGETDPSDESVLYAISSKDQKLKGILVNGYGIYTEPMTDEMIQKLSISRT
jgi:hypothetical protein